MKFLNVSALLALSSMVFYALANTILDEKMKQFSVLTVMVWWCGGTFLLSCLAAAGWHFFYQPLVWPQGPAALGWTNLLSVLFFVADVAIIAAYAAKGHNLLTVTSLTIVFPIAAAAFGWLLFNHSSYTKGQILAAAFVAVGVVLFAYYSPDEKEEVSSDVSVTAQLE